VAGWSEFGFTQLPVGGRTVPVLGAWTGCAEQLVSGSGLPAGLRPGLQHHVELVLGYSADVAVPAFSQHGAQL
jgi:hypothetical protein